MRFRRRQALLSLGALLAGGSGAAAALAAREGSSTSAGANSVTYARTPTSPGLINPAAVPLGDGYVSTTPKVGYVDSCVTHFGGGGASAVGPWINTKNKTWDYNTKVEVNGHVNWPSSSYRVQTTGQERVITFNDLPIDHATGIFPIQKSSKAYEYDQNPNKIEAHSLTWRLPLHPKAAGKPSCTPPGPIGVLDDGVVLFNALDALGHDAAAHELLDVCAGHPAPGDIYHHHDVPPCILDKVPKGATRLVGYALDGYGIYVVKNRRGQLPNNLSLDACHGTTSTVMWDGKMTRIYHYVATLEYPYTVGCFHGAPISSGLGGSGAGAGPGGGGGPGQSGAP